MVVVCGGWGGWALASVGLGGFVRGVIPEQTLLIALLPSSMQFGAKPMCWHPLCVNSSIRLRQAEKRSLEDISLLLIIVRRTEKQ